MHLLIAWRRHRLQGTKPKKSDRSAPFIPQTDLFHRRHKEEYLSREREMGSRRSPGGSSLRLKPDWGGSRLELAP